MADLLGTAICSLLSVILGVLRDELLDLLDLIDLVEQGDEEREREAISMCVMKSRTQRTLETARLFPPASIHKRSPLRAMKGVLGRCRRAWRKFPSFDTQSPCLPSISLGACVFCDLDFDGVDNMR